MENQVAESSKLTIRKEFFELAKSSESNAKSLSSEVYEKCVQFIFGKLILKFVESTYFYLLLKFKIIKRKRLTIEK